MDLIVENGLVFDGLGNPSLLEERKTRNTLGQYLEHLEGLPLGPHVAAFMGHSALRACA